MKKIATVVILLSSTAASLHAENPVTKEKMLDRFLSYVKINSQSQPASGPDEFPMTPGQGELAAFMAEEIKSFGKNVQCTVSADNYVYVSVPANVKGKGIPVLGFSCHLDVTPECVSSPVKPSVLYDYKGGDIRLNDNTYIRTDSPEGADLKDCIGKTIIHTDGNTLLGADDKCGCSIVISLIERAIKDKKFKHGPLQFVICPNEDVGLSAARIDTTLFNPDMLFDADGIGVGDITRANFTAKQVIVRFNGHDAHPGNAKALNYGDALAAASWYIAQFPLESRPERTEGLGGYIHPWSMTTDGKNNYTVSVRVRYFSQEEGRRFDKYLNDAYESAAEAFPNVSLETIDNSLQYENVAYSMHPKSFDVVAMASEKTGVKVSYIDERGGTTASMFCAKGMKGGMNLFSGQHSVHSVYEYAVLEEMYDTYGFACAIAEAVTKL